MVSIIWWCMHDLRRSTVPNADRGTGFDAPFAVKDRRGAGAGFRIRPSGAIDMMLPACNYVNQVDGVWHGLVTAVKSIGICLSGRIDTWYGQF